MNDPRNAGKGDSPRPVDREKYAKNYERIFGPRPLPRPWCPTCDGRRAVRDKDGGWEPCPHCLDY